MDAVSTLLGGHKIDGFAMVNMSAIEVVNDMVGGVTVTIEDDFPDSDTLIKGQTVTLHGEGRSALHPCSARPLPTD